MEKWKNEWKGWEMREKERERGREEEGRKRGEKENQKKEREGNFNTSLFSFFFFFAQCLKLICGRVAYDITHTLSHTQSTQAQSTRVDIMQSHAVGRRPLACLLACLHEKKMETMAIT